MEETKIKTLVENGNLHGALNDMLTSGMTNAYHKDFAIFYAAGKELKKLFLNDWIKMVEDYKKNNDPPGLRKFDHAFTQIDVTGDAAFIKLKLMRNGELIFTDLITLLKFEGEWKVVTKIYHAHIKDPWRL